VERPDAFLIDEYFHERSVMRHNGPLIGMHERSYQNPAVVNTGSDPRSPAAAAGSGKMLTA
jgi:hypothetical protein